MHFGHSSDEQRYYYRDESGFRIMTGPTVRTTGLVGAGFVIVPVKLSDNGLDYRTMVTIGSYKSTPSKSDNIVRGKAEVEGVQKMIRKLLSFQSRKVGVKQPLKTVMPTELNGFKFGAKVKVKKDFTIKSYRGAGAEVVGFTESGQAVLNYSKADKLVHTSYLEAVTMVTGKK